MGSCGQRFPLLLSLLFLWSVGYAYDDSICDEPNPGIFCTCDSKYRDTSVVCYITLYLDVHNGIWRSLSKVEDLTTLKLNSMTEEMKLDYIPTESLQGMDSLRKFKIQQAELGALKSNAFSELKELRELELDGNDITSLEKNAIFNLPKLKKLSLSENLLQEILADTFKDVLELEQLFLDRNNISRIEGFAFSNLQNLRDLELFGNSITDLTEYMFIGLRYLHRLDLYKNQIRILTDKVFHAMPKLVELDLSDNSISHVAPKAFHGLLNLQKLMLNSNKIKILPDVVFKSLPTLRNVDLYYNQLESLQVEVLQNMANVKDMHFSLAFKDNPIQCDCRLQWVNTYIRHNKSHMFTRELQELRCRSSNDENVTMHTVRLMQLNCSSTIPPMIHKDKKHPASTLRSIDKSASVVPYTIHRNNKTRMTTVITEDMSEIQDAEAVDEEMVDDSTEPSGSVLLVADLKLIVLVTLLTVFLVRRRKGTLL